VTQFDYGNELSKASMRAERVEDAHDHHRHMASALPDQRSISARLMAGIGGTADLSPRAQRSGFLRPVARRSTGGGIETSEKRPGISRPSGVAQRVVLGA
jgi:hypothetical protein